MDMEKRIEMVKAMELLARHVNNEDVFGMWLMLGVADRDIRKNTKNAELTGYCSDERFADLMETFLELMSRAKKSGGLYCDGIVSEYE